MYDNYDDWGKTLQEDNWMIVKVYVLLLATQVSQGLVTEHYCLFRIF